MPPKKKGNEKEKVTQDTEVPTISKFSLYKDPATGHIPEVIINLIKEDIYHSSINTLRTILSSCRDNDKLIAFKVRSPSQQGFDKSNLPIFLMKCSDIYIVGYMLSNQIYIFGYDKLRYPNLEVRSQFSFQDIQTNPSSLHALGYVVAEAVRSIPIEIYISKLIKQGAYSIDVAQSILGISEYVNPKNYEIFNDINNMLSKLSTYEIAHRWGRDEIGREKIEALLKQNNEYYHSIVGWMFDILTKMESLENQMEEHLQTISDDNQNEQQPSNNADHVGKVIIPATASSEASETLKDNLEQQDLDEIAIEIESDSEDFLNLETANELQSIVYRMQLNIQYLENNEPEASIARHQEWEKEYSELLRDKESTEAVILIIRTIHYFDQSHAMENAYQALTAYNRGKVDSKTAVKSLPRLTNGTSVAIDISPGMYNSDKGSYSKIPGSEGVIYSLSDYKPDDDKGGNAVKLNIKQNEDTSNKEYIIDTDIVSLTINQFLSWIWILPEWLQEQILNTTPIKSFIENTKKDAAIYSKKSLDTHISKLFDDKMDNEDSSEWNYSYNKATIKLSTEELIDTSMIAKSSSINIWILPMIIIGLSNNLVSQYDFGSPIGFNEKIMIDLF